MFRLQLTAFTIHVIALYVSGLPSGSLLSRLGGTGGFDDFFKDLDTDFPTDLSVPDGSDPNTRTITKTKTETRITKCVDGKCTTCVNGECREHPMSEADFPEIPDIKFPSFGSFFKSGSGDLDIDTAPDGTKTTTKTSSHTKITRCDQDGCVTCVDDECTDADKAGFGNSCAFSSCPSGYHCNEFFNCVEGEASSEEETALPVLPKPQPKPSKKQPPTKKLKVPKYCDSTLDCEGGYKCRSGYCLPTEERINI